MAIKGAIIGDIIGSQYEFKKPKGFDSKTAVLLSNKSKFTDDSVMTIATKYAIEHNVPFSYAYQFLGTKYPDAGYGNRFLEWIENQEDKPYGSYGNGSAMRVSFIADHFNDSKQVVEYARKSAECTHNHPEGVKGAIVTAMCTWIAKKEKTNVKETILNYTIKHYPRKKYKYSASFTLDEIKKNYIWNESCQGSVPVAIRCVYEANNYTEFIRNVLSLNCDADTLCAIGGGVAEELFDNTDDEIMQCADNILEYYLDDYLLSLLRR